MIGRMQEQLNALTDSIIGAAIEVHKALGPGMLESAYDACMAMNSSREVYASSDRSRCHPCTEDTRLTAVTGAISSGKLLSW
jgi:GxxExxY protein